MSETPTNEPVRIVHLEDDPADHELVRETLRDAAFELSIEHVSTREGFREALGSRPDLVLSDLSLPGFDGLAALAMARRLIPDLPFVLVSGTIGEDAAIESLRSGATDYVLKHRLSRLLPAVNRALEEAAERRTRRAAEATLARERSFLLALLDSLQVGVVACDADGRVTLVNRATRQMHGLAPEGVLDHEFRSNFRLFAVDGTTPLGPDEFPLTRALRGEVLENVEIWIQRGTGEPRAVLVSGRPIVDDSSVQLGAVVAVHDVTEQRELERQFRQSQKMEAMGALAAGVAHDFNNILTAIMGHAQLLKAKLGTGSPEFTHVEEVMRAANRAAGLTRQLLAFTRQQILAPRVLDLNELVTDLDRMLRRMIDANIDLMTAPTPGLGRVMADLGQFEQVLMNLVVNARDAMPQGGKLTIETANVVLDDRYAGQGIDLKPGPYVMLAVSDTGCGMTPEITARIFEPFFTTKEVGKGTGLGLSTVHGIVKQSGGHIEVYSELGNGTTFKVYLPQVDGNPEVATGTPSGPGDSGGNEAVMLVEDDTMIRRVLKRSLELLGYTVYDAQDGSEALARLQDSGLWIDILVTDVVMPLMSGPELAERLAHGRPGMATLFISGYTSHALIHRGLRREGTAFLQKPFTPDVLARRIRDVLDARLRDAA